MRAWLRGISQLALIFGFVGFLSSETRADPVYSVTNLGPASPSAAYLSGSSQLDPSGNYLGALTAADRATFQAGSFDVYAHPANAPDLTNVDLGGGHLSGDSIDQTLWNPYMVTSNDLGVNLGYATWRLSDEPGISYPQIAMFTPGPHTMSVESDFSVLPRQIESPGYLFGPATTIYGLEEGGAVAGINDHGNIVFTERYLASLSPNLMPYLSGQPGVSGGYLPLGSLGGTSGQAEALNNANQVVGWSQTASGAQHAFVYSNGTMQDLNLLIPISANINLTSAVGIDGSGRIVAYGTDASGQTDEFLLTPLVSPVPEPSTLAVFGLMIAAIAARRVRSGRSSDEAGRSNSRPGPDSD